MHYSLRLIATLLVLILLSSCNDSDVLPKPSGQLALDFPKGNYVETENTGCPFSFELNEYARVLAKRDCSMKIEYPGMDATIYLNYRPVQDNLRQLLIDGQKLSYEHNQKADVIADYPFVNQLNKSYGMMYEIEGNAASNAQFYVTDSTKHFLTAALYFNTQPNYDSILPAVDYVKSDMVKMMETLTWRD
ncbi:gliding motility-associated lipoprotein GldD [Nonlabens dokdonensis]|uniref:Gliding motility protein n=2 Tax=Nonlabens dokdonensis TaxID=328515 RepID=L7W970_NONDD|nr:gliding motility protein [Nonlabens dokdonensis DSW-6]PZX44342.1 gliding motility-associated lipoprotein GldD [Nonlabens dokdonensis]